MIILGVSSCTLCGRTLCVGQALVATADTCMHQECFLRWDRRAEFVAEYNRQAPIPDPGSSVPYWQMQADGSFVITPLLAQES